MGGFLIRIPPKRAAGEFDIIFRLNRPRRKGESASSVRFIPSGIFVYQLSIATKAIRFNKQKILSLY